jgi:hypothetical protein
MKSGKNSLMLGDYTIWQGMFGSGVLIIGAMITVVELMVLGLPVNLEQFGVDAGGVPPLIVAQVADKKQTKIIPVIPSAFGLSILSK